MLYESEKEIEEKIAEKALEIMNAKLQIIAMLNQVQPMSEEESHSQFALMEEVRGFVQALFNKGIELDPQDGYKFEEEPQAVN